MPEIITEYPQYFTATILQWKKLLRLEKYKDIIFTFVGVLQKSITPLLCVCAMALQRCKTPTTEL